MQLFIIYMSVSWDMPQSQMLTGRYVKVATAAEDNKLLLIKAYILN